MPDAYKCVQVVVTVHGVTVGVVDSLTMELEHEGGAEHVYGTVTPRHAIGGNRATYSVRRWFMVDADPDLLFDLFETKVPFTMSGQVSGVANSTVTLSNCIAYSYRPVFGAANDKTGEEISGEATSFTGPT